MTIACLTAAAADPLLLRAWLAYHGYILGFENLHVLAPPTPPGAGGDTPIDHALADYAGLGVTIHRLDAIGFPARRAEIRRTDPGPCILADRCDSFLAIVAEAHVTARRTDILAELGRAAADGVSLRNPVRLVSLPGTRDIFELTGNDDALRVTARLPDDDTASSPDTRLITITLGPRVAMDPPADSYVTLRHWPTLLTLLSPEIRSWSRAPVLPPRTLLIDIEATGFTRSGYRDANPDTRHIDPFHHFVSDGYREGRRASASATAYDEVASRMATIRDIRDDGHSGLIGLALGMSRIGRVREADGILADAIARHGRTPALLREYALLATYADLRTEAPARWAAFREVNPDDPIGSLYGATAHRALGEFAAAARLVADGLARWPDAVDFATQQAELAGERGDWAQAETLWRAILARRPDDQVVRERLSSAGYRLRLNQMERGTVDDDAFDVPESMPMSASELAATLAALALPDSRALRSFFMTFESLGSTCEFGIVQRRGGAEPLGLLRWSSLPHAGLLRGLEAGFQDIERTDNLDLRRAGAEYILEDRLYATAMHTFIHGIEGDVARTLEQLARRMSLLRRKLVADLELGEKIFVRLNPATTLPDAHAAIETAFRARSNGVLLQVQAAQHASQSGQVTALSPRSLVGWIARDGRRADGSWDIDFAGWLAVCRQARAFCQESASF